jgi:hypothetical protein
LGRMCTVHLIGPGVHIRGAPGEPKREAQHAAPPVRTLCVGDTASAVTGGHRLAPDFAKALVSGLERHRTPRPDTPPARFPSSQRGFDSPHPLSPSRGVSAGHRRFLADRGFALSRAKSGRFPASPGLQPAWPAPRWHPPWLAARAGAPLLCSRSPSCICDHMGCPRLREQPGILTPGNPQSTMVFFHADAGVCLLTSRGTSPACTCES